MIKSFVVPCVGAFLVVSIALGQPSGERSQRGEDTAMRFQRIAVVQAPKNTQPSGARMIKLNEAKDTAAVAMYGCRTVFWDLKKNQAIGLPTRQSGDAGAIEFIPNTDLVCIADWSNLQVWNYKTAQKNSKGFPHKLREDTVMGPAVSPDGKVLATRSQMESLQLFDLKTHQSMGPEHVQERLVTKLQFSADGKWCFTSAGALFIWKTTTGERVAAPIRNNIYATAYLPENQSLATFEHDYKNPSSQSQVIIRSGKSGWAKVREFQLPGQASGAEWIDGNRLLVVGREPGEKYKTIVFLVSLEHDPPEFQVLSNSEYRVFDFAITKDRKHLVTISISKVSCWEIGESKPKWEKPWTGSFWRKRLYASEADWVLAHARGDDAIAFAIEDGAELWRKKEAIYADTNDDHIVVTDKTGGEVWRWRDGGSENSPK